MLQSWMSILIRPWTFLQILLFHVIGYLTGYKTEREWDEKKRFQETADQLQQNLKILNEQAEKLSNLEEQLRQTDRLSVIGELTASLAHEVRNPLGSIRGAVEIMREEIPGNLQKSDFFKILIEETQRLNTVVENYLQYARRQSPEKRKFDIRESIQNAEILLSRQFARNNHHLMISIPDHPCTTLGDPNQLWQILINLLLNADQAMPEKGEIHIDLQRIDETLEIQAKQPAKSEYTMFKLDVKDQGIGISEELIGKIYKPFYTSKSTGTGLGLAIVKRLSDENNWQLNVESNPDNGTIFSLIIPGNEG